MNRQFEREEGYIPFSLQNDFEGGQWIDGEFLYEKEKKRKRQTKEQIMLGIWAGSSDEEDNGKPKDYAAPISFVKGNVMNVNEVEEKPNIIPAKDKNPFAPTPTKPGHSAVLRDVAKVKWDTNGIASKLMSKMGYKGGGLGKNEQGRVDPINVIIRPKNMGLAFDDFEERTEQSIVDQHPELDVPLANWMSGTKKQKTVYQKNVVEPYQSTIVDMRGPTTKVFKPQDTSYADTTVVRPTMCQELQFNLNLVLDSSEANLSKNQQKIKYEENLQSQLEKQRVVYTEQLEVEVGKIEKLEQLLELITKTQGKIEDNKEVSIEFLLEIFRTLQNKYIREWNLYNLDSLAFHLVFPKIESIMSTWLPLEQPLFPIPAITAWKPLLDLTHIATKQLQKQQQRRIEERNNTISPLSGMGEDDDEVKAAIQAAKDPNRVNVYTQLFYSVVFPKLRHCLTHDWNPRDHERGTKLVQAWSTHLPPQLLQILLENVIMTRLNQEVQKWNPLTDRQLISDWIHPWAPILGNILDILTERILEKLSPVLAHWRPKDASAFVLLSPWKKVVTEPAIFEKFLVKTILPKLEIAMTEWNVNPSDQDLSVWNAVIQWSSVFSTEIFIPFLLRTFFQKWFKALITWLQSGPNFEEVYRWYTHWKDCFPKNYQEEPIILHQFRKALEMANAIMEDPTRPLSPPSIMMPQTPFVRDSPQIKRPPSTPAPTVRRTPATTVDDIQFSLRNLVEKYAEDHNLLFVPTKKSWDGKPVYTFGAVSIVIDKELLYYCKKGKWELTSLEALRKRAQKK